MEWIFLTLNRSATLRCRVQQLGEPSGSSGHSHETTPSNLNVKVRKPLCGDRLNKAGGACHRWEELRCQAVRPVHDQGLLTSYTRCSFDEGAREAAAAVSGPRNRTNAVVAHVKDHIPRCALNAVRRRDNSRGCAARQPPPAAHGALCGSAGLGVFTCHTHDTHALNNSRRPLPTPPDSPAQQTRLPARSSRSPFQSDNRGAPRDVLNNSHSKEVQVLDWC